MYKNEVIKNCIPIRKTIETCNALKYAPQVAYSDTKPNPKVEDTTINKYYSALDYYDENNNRFIHEKLIDEKNVEELMKYYSQLDYYKNLPPELLFYYCKALIGEKLNKNEYRKIGKQEKKELEKFKKEEKVNYKKKNCNFVLRFD